MMSTKFIFYGLLILLSVHFSVLMPIQSLHKRDADTTTDATTQSMTTDNTTTETNQTEETAQETDEAPQEIGAFQTIDDCECRRKDDSESCQSLESAIYKFYFREDNNYDTPYQFFSLKELFFAALLDGEDNSNLQPTPLQGVDFNAGAEEDRGRTNCWFHRKNYNFITTDTSSCKWDYECTQNRLQFPSFTMEAVLSNDSSTEICSPVTMTNKKFLRTSCQHDSSLPHWLECNCGNTVVGYQNNLTES